MSDRIYLLPLWLRLWHWTNATLIILLTATGISLHFADPQLMLIEFSLAQTVHNVAGLALAAAYGFFVIANIVSGNWWQYVPKPGGFLKRCWIQTRFYVWGIFWGEPHPFPITLKENFNPLQQIIYWAVMYLAMPALLLTGLLFLFPAAAPEQLFGMDGLLPVAIAHFVVGLIIVLFLLGHIYLATTGKTPTAMVRTMITGWHEH